MQLHDKWCACPDCLKNKRPELNVNEIQDLKNQLQEAHYLIREFYQGDFAGVSEAVRDQASEFLNRGMQDV